MLFQNHKLQPTHFNSILIVLSFVLIMFASNIHAVPITTAFDIKLGEVDWNKDTAGIGDSGVLTFNVVGDTFTAGNVGISMIESIDFVSTSLDFTVMGTDLNQKGSGAPLLSLDSTTQMSKCW